MNSELLVQNGMEYTENFLAHYGKGHLDGGHSGRYPWNSGKNPKQSEQRDEEEDPWNYIDRNGKLTNKGRKHYGFDDVARKLSGKNISAYELYRYSHQGLDMYTDSYVKEVKKNPELLKALESSKELINKVVDDLEDSSAYRFTISEQLAKRADDLHMQNQMMELFGIKRGSSSKTHDQGAIKHIGMEYAEDFLAHYGRSKLDGAPVGSGCYPLGSGEDPYQMFTRGKTDAPRGLAGVISKLKRHGGGVTVDEKKRIKQELKIKADEEKKQAHEEAERKNAEKAKQDIENKKTELLRKGDVKEILKNQELFSTQELQNAIDRNSKLETLRSKVPVEKGAIDKLDKAFGTIGKVSKWIDTGAQFARSVKNLRSVMSPQQEQQKISLGQRYAAELLASLKNKSLDDIDFGNVSAQMGKINTINSLYNMAVKGQFGSGGKGDQRISGVNTEKNANTQVFKPAAAKGANQQTSIFKSSEGEAATKKSQAVKEERQRQEKRVEELKADYEQMKKAYKEERQRQEKRVEELKDNYEQLKKAYKEQEKKTKEQSEKTEHGSWAQEWDEERRKQQANSGSKK